MIIAGITLGYANRLESSRRLSRRVGRAERQPGGGAAGSQPTGRLQAVEAAGTQHLARRCSTARPKGVTPTAAGEVLAGYARRLFALVGEAEQAMDELRGLGRGSLSVGASTTVGVYLLPDVFVKFRREHPGVTVRMEIAASDVLHERLLAGSIDLALTEGKIDDPAPRSRKSFCTTSWRPSRPRATRSPSGEGHRGRPLPRAFRRARDRQRDQVAGRAGAGRPRACRVRPAMSLGSTEAIKLRRSGRRRRGRRLPGRRRGRAGRGIVGGGPAFRPFAEPARLPDPPARPAPESGGGRVHRPAVCGAAAGRAGGCDERDNEPREGETPRWRRGPGIPAERVRREALPPRPEGRGCREPAIPSAAAARIA